MRACLKSLHNPKSAVKQKGWKQWIGRIDEECLISPLMSLVKQSLYAYASTYLDTNLS